MVPGMCIDPILGWDQYQECEIMGAFYSAPKIPGISVRNQMEHTDFGLVWREYLGPPLKVVHFDRSAHFSWTEMSLSIILSKSEPQMGFEPMTLCVLEHLI